MARGWESKSVEAQVEAAGQKPEPHRAMSAEEIAHHQKKEALRLSRARILQQLQATQDPRYLKLLQKTLADLERQIAEAK